MSRRILALTALPSLLAATVVVGCLSEGGLAPTAATTADGGTGPSTVITTPDGGTTVVLPPDAAVDDPTKNDAIKDSAQAFLTYRDDLTQHPGCVQDLTQHVDGVGDLFPVYAPAVLPNFPCSAKEFNVPTNEDTTRAVIILVHGNSSSPGDFQNNGTPIDTSDAVVQLAPTLANDGWHVYQADFRVDKVNDPTNAADNVDHGWTVPILEALIRGVHAKYPTRKINLAGFSLGPTVIRDALRRMHHAGEMPFSYVHAVHLASGANHGVSTFQAYCGDVNNPKVQNMVGWAACQLGNRTGFVPTPFLDVLNGPSGAYETPCADGIHAYGQYNVCGANAVLYTTSVFADQPDGSVIDQFVSQQSAALLGAQNATVTQDDTSGFLKGYFAHHYGSIRSQQGVDIAKAALER